jgi:hypothetical protein
MTKRGSAAESSTAASERIELKGLYAMMLGVWYPRNYIVAAIDPTQGAAALKALLSAGFGSNSVRLEDGARVGQIRAAIYEQRTPLQRATVPRSMRGSPAGAEGSTSRRASSPAWRTSGRICGPSSRRAPRPGCARHSRRRAARSAGNA